MTLIHSDGVLAFLEGIALIASPCILPILPFILATSITGSRRRPFLIILGFILSFTLFTLFARKIILLTGIQQETIRRTAFGFLLLLGILILVPSFEKAFAWITGRLATHAEKLSRGTHPESIFEALIAGMLIGLVWTPCAGPILGAALIQAVSAQTSLNVFIVIAAFGIGSGVPLLIITLFGQQLMRHIRLLAQYTRVIRYGMGLLIIIFAFVGLAGINWGAWLVTPAYGIESDNSPYQEAPAIAGVTQWFNTKPLTPADLKNKVVLVDFWTYSCINCIRTFPTIEGWYKKYKDKGFIVIGVHSPEFPFETDPANVEKAVKAFKLTYPIAMDNDYVTWSNFNNHYWPANYLISRSGKLVYSHFGEGGEEQTENAIRELLGLTKTHSLEPTSAPTNFSQTPETYLGYERAERFASPESMAHDQSQHYSFPGKLERNNWALSGVWTIQKDHIVAGAKHSRLMIYFTAAKVYLVLGDQIDNKPITLSLKLNGTPLKPVTVTEHKLYLLVNQPTSSNGILEIETPKPNLEAYAFTFGK